jgi:hypothetical protein
MKLDTLMGGGANEEAIMLCAQSIIEYYPDLTGPEFLHALRHGVKNVDWYGKMTFMTVAKFIREWQVANPPKPRTGWLTPTGE